MAKRSDIWGDVKDGIDLSILKSNPDSTSIPVKETAQPERQVIKDTAEKHNFKSREPKPKKQGRPKSPLTAQMTFKTLPSTEQRFNEIRYEFGPEGRPVVQGDMLTQLVRFWDENHR